MKILFSTLADLSRPIGAGVHVRELVRHLEGRGHEVILVPGRFFPRGGLLLRGAAYGARLAGVFLGTLRSVRRADLLYMRDAVFGLFAVPLARLGGKPLVFEINGLGGVEQRMSARSVIHLAFSRLKTCAERFTARGAVRIVSVTAGIRDHLVRNCGVGVGKVAVIPNGVDPERWGNVGEEAREDALRGIGIGEKGPLVLFVGSLSRWQGVDTLIRSAPEVLKSFPRALFLVVGGGPIGRELEGLAEALGVRESFLFAGYRPHGEVPALVSAADVCVALKRELPSGYSPIKVYEYLASGRPVVAGRVSGLEEIEEEGAGILVAPGDAGETAGAILRLLRDRDLRERMGERARCIAPNHSWERVAARVEEVLKQALTA